VVVYVVVPQDILKDQWSPALTIKTALISLQALLCTPQPDDPQDAEVASMYMNSHETFVNTAKFWTETYARPDSSHDEVKGGLACDRDACGFERASIDVNFTVLWVQVVKRLMEMGFSEEDSKKALEENNWDETAAINALLSA
jgi:ubiquitin-conjugating enzyme (huntingtin interacting protein 2)